MKFHIIYSHFSVLKVLMWQLGDVAVGIKDTSIIFTSRMRTTERSNPAKKSTTISHLNKVPPYFGMHNISGMEEREFFLVIANILLPSPTTLLSVRGWISHKFNHLPLQIQNWTHECKIWKAQCLSNKVQRKYRNLFFPSCNCINSV